MSNLQALYNRMKDDQYELPSFSVFSKRLQNPKNSRVVYDTLLKDGYSNLGRYDEFQSRIKADPMEIAVATGEQSALEGFMKNAMDGSFYKNPLGFSVKNDSIDEAVSSLPYPMQTSANIDKLIGQVADSTGLGESREASEDRYSKEQSDRKNAMLSAEANAQDLKERYGGYSWWRDMLDAAANATKYIGQSSAMGGSGFGTFARSINGLDSLDHMENERIDNASKEKVIRRNIKGIEDALDKYKAVEERPDKDWIDTYIDWSKDGWKSAYEAVRKINPLEYGMSDAVVTTENYKAFQRLEKAGGDITKLDPLDQDLIKSAMQKTSAQNNSGKGTFMQQVGESAGNSVEFMINMPFTSPVGTLANAGIKKGIGKLGTKILKEMTEKELMRNIVKETFKYGGKVIGGIGDSASRALITPRMLGDAVESNIGMTEVVNGDNGLEYNGYKGGKDNIAKALWDSSMSTGIEYLTEIYTKPLMDIAGLGVKAIGGNRLSNAFDGVSKKQLYKYSRDLYNKLGSNPTTRNLRNTFKIYDPIIEAAGEEFSGILHTINGEGSLDDNLGLDQQKVIAGTILSMGAGFGTVNMATRQSGIYKTSKAIKRAESGMIGSGYTADQVKEAQDIIRNSDGVDQMYEKLNVFQKNSESLTQDQKDAMERLVIAEANRKAYTMAYDDYDQWRKNGLRRDLDGMSHQGLGEIIEVNLVDGSTAYMVGGNVAFDKSGNVDLINSDNSVIFMMPDKTHRQGSIREITTVSERIPTEQAYSETLDAMSQQDQMIADAEEKRAQEQQAQDDQDGSGIVGQTISTQGKEGRVLSVNNGRVLVDYGDGEIGSHSQEYVRYAIDGQSGLFGTKISIDGTNKEVVGEDLDGNVLLKGDGGDITRSSIEQINQARNQKREVIHEGNLISEAGRDNQGNVLIDSYDNEGLLIGRHAVTEEEANAIFGVINDGGLPPINETDRVERSETTISKDVQAQEQKEEPDSIDTEESGQQYSYPTNKNGEVDESKFSIEDHLNYSIENEGIEVARTALDNEITRVDKLISASKKKLEKAPLDGRSKIVREINVLETKRRELTSLKDKYFQTPQEEESTKPEEVEEVAQNNNESSISNISGELYETNIRYRILSDIASGKMVFLRSDIGKEMGWSFSSPRQKVVGFTELNKRIGLLNSKTGSSIIALSEQMKADLPENLSSRYEVEDIRNEIISVINTVISKSSAMKMLKEMEQDHIEHSNMTESYGEHIDEDYFGNIDEMVERMDSDSMLEEGISMDDPFESTGIVADTAIDLVRNAIGIDMVVVQPKEEFEDNIGMGNNQGSESVESIALTEAEKEVNQNPSDGQKDAGNYKKGHLKLFGMDITIENPKGSTRSGVDPNGVAWEVEMNNTYGYIKGTKGKDGDHIDVFISENPVAGKIYVVDQVDPSTGKFDEHKVMVGFEDESNAKDAYMNNYSPGWKGFGNITEVSQDEFNTWLSQNDGSRKIKPFAEYSINQMEKAEDKSEDSDSKEPINEMEEFENPIVSDVKNSQTKTDEDQSTRNLKTNSGTVYGYTKGGRIYLNGDVLNGNTPIHEYTHLWADAVRRRNPELWDKGVELLKQTSLWDKIANDQNYSYLKGDDFAIADEVIARLSGEKGEALLEEMSQEFDTSKSLIDRVKNWIQEFWQEVKSAFSEWTHKDIEDLTLEDFVKMPMRELVSGSLSPTGSMNQEIPNDIRMRIESKDREIGNSVNAKMWGVSDRIAEEMESIKDSAIKKGQMVLKKDGSYDCLAPNGALSNLSERQWLQVRTKSFKNWFGDWEKSDRIKKMLEAPSIEISGDEITENDDLRVYKKNALEYGKKLRGGYVNNDTGVYVLIGKNGIREILQHDYKNVSQLQSVSAIPQIIENAIYIDSMPNRDTKVDAEKFDYYVCGLNIGGVNYTVRAVFVTPKEGTKYYDHKLTKIEKGKLLDSLIGITNPGFNQKDPFFENKDKKLISILQTNSSKVVDENGEPMVVYHGTDSNFNTFKVEELRDREGSFFFAQNKEDADSYSSDGNVMSVFINIKNPFDYENGVLAEEFRDKYRSSKNKREQVEVLKEAGYDGFISDIESGWGEISCFSPNQIKSAEKNNGEYSSDFDDIRFRAESIGIDVSEMNEWDQADLDCSAIERRSGANNWLVGIIKEGSSLSNSVELNPDGIDKLIKKTTTLIDQLNQLHSNSIGIRQACIERHLYQSGVLLDAYQQISGSDRMLKEEFKSIMDRVGDTLIGGKANTSTNTLRDFASALGTKFGIEIQCLESEQDIRDVRVRSRMRGLKGWYDVSSGKVYVYLPNCQNSSDMERTILHEVIAHHGLRSLFGDRFDTFLDQVYEQASDDIRASIDSIIDSTQKVDDISRRRIATEEYMASLAEAGFKEGKVGFIAKVKSIFNALLESIGINLRWSLSDNDLRYILWRSYKNLSSSKADISRDIDMQKECGVRSESSTISSDGTVLFRSVSFGEKPKPEDFDSPYKYVIAMRKWLASTNQTNEDLQKSFNKVLNDSKTEFRRQTIDEDALLKSLQDLIVDNGGTITDSEDVWNDKNRSKGRVNDRIDKFNNDYIVPITSIYRKIKKNVNLRRFKNINSTLNEYLSGVEKSTDNTSWDSRIIGLYLQALDMKEASEMHLPDRGKKGFLETTGIGYAEYIEAFEKVCPSELYEELQLLVKGATHAALYAEYDAGILGKEEYDKFSLRKHYVPQRNWDERDQNDEAKKQSEYYNIANRVNSSYSPLAPKAKGRKSLASDPLSLIQSIGHSAIVTSEKNLYKQKALNLIRNNQQLGRLSDQFYLKQIWYVNTGERDSDGNIIWEETYIKPDKSLIDKNNDIWEEIKKKRKEVYSFKKNRDAKMLESALSELDDLYESIQIRTDVNSNYRVMRTASESSMNEVYVYEHGVKMKMIFSDVRIANSLNNTRKNINTGYADNRLGKYTKWMAGVLTQYNPNFAMANMQRDFLFALPNAIALGGGKMAKRFASNYFNSKVHSAIRAHITGAKVDKKTSNPFHRLLHEFFEDGAATGYAFLQDIDDLKKNLNVLSDIEFDGSAKRKYLKANETVKKVLSSLTEYSEMMGRFSAYVSARESGFTREQSATFAKNLTTNFNRRGVFDGDYQNMSKPHQIYASLLGFMVRYVPFTNASIQGIEAGKGIFKKAVGVAISYATINFVAGLLSSLFKPNDDDENPTAFTEYDYKTSYVIGDIKIAAPNYFRPFVALGANMAMVMRGERAIDHAIFDSMSMIASDMMPINPLDFFKHDDLNGGYSFTIQGFRQFSPAVASPFIDVYTNSTFTGGKIHKTEREEIANAFEGRDDVAEWAKEFSLFAYKMAGGDPNTKSIYRTSDGGKIIANINPSDLQHVVMGYLGGTGKFVIQTSDAVQKIVQGEEVGIAELPVVSVFSKKYNPEKAERLEHYKLKAMINKINTQVRDMEKGAEASSDPKYIDRINQITSSKRYEYLQVADEIMKSTEEIRNYLKRDGVSQWERDMCEKALSQNKTDLKNISKLIQEQ